MDKTIFDPLLIIDQTVSWKFVRKEEPKAILPEPNLRDEIVQRLHFDRTDRLESISYHAKEKQ